jgi:hypothetical protein
MDSLDRPVRIPRRPTSTEFLPPTPAETPGVPAQSYFDRTPSTAPRFNRAATQRGTRLFLLFVLLLVVIYLVFVGSSFASTHTGDQNEVVEFLSAFLVLFAVVGWFVTLAGTPRSAWTEAGALVVRERSGRVSHYAIGPELRLRVVRRNAVSFLAPQPTEYVEVTSLHRRRRTYLVGREFFDFLPVQVE